MKYSVIKTRTATYVLSLSTSVTPTYAHSLSPLQLFHSFSHSIFCSVFLVAVFLSLSCSLHLFLSTHLYISLFLSLLLFLSISHSCSPYPHPPRLSLALYILILPDSQSTHLIHFALILAI